MSKQEIQDQQEKKMTKKLVISPPPPLPENLDKLISQLYMAFWNELTGVNWFGTSSLREVLFELKEVLQIEQTVKAT